MQSARGESARSALVERVRDKERADRDKYYAERISASGQHSRAFYGLAGMMSRRNGPVATEVAEREVGKPARFRPRQSIQDVLEADVAASLFVYEEQAEGYLPGIPSIVTYLRRRAEVFGGRSSHRH